PGGGADGLVPRPPAVPPAAAGGRPGLPTVRRLLAHPPGCAAGAGRRPAGPPAHTPHPQPDALRPPRRLAPPRGARPDPPPPPAPCCPPAPPRPPAGPPAHTPHPQPDALRPPGRLARPRGAGRDAPRPRGPAARADAVPGHGRPAGRVLPPRPGAGLDAVRL